MSTAKKPVNYLNNKDILKEIHLSKNSYCCFSKQEYHQYDLIINAQTPPQPLEKALAQLSKPKNIKAAKEARINRILTETGKELKPKDINPTDLVFRVMTWDHIPVSPKQPRKLVKKKTAQDIIEFADDEEAESFDDLEDDITKDDVDDKVHVKVNFPPFQHYKLDEDGNPICVGKSHWHGGVKTGEFSKEHGKLTDKLGRILIMLCEKYAMKYNWRGYTYNDEMRGSAILQLTYVGLRFNEARSNNPFAYYTAAITNAFRRVLNTEKKNQNIRDDILEMHGLNPSWTRQNSNSSDSHEE